ncbi:MAG: TRAP transporter small permease subunit [Burkholderiaceae bacterium]
MRERPTVLRLFVRLLSGITIVQLVALAIVVLYAVAARTLGHSPSWYDEVASVMLAWLTFVGAALATARNAHLNFELLLMRLPAAARWLVFVAGEAVFHGTFIVIAWAGWRILEIFGGETLVSLTWVPLEIVHAIVPVGAALVIIARLLVSADNWRRVMAGIDLDSAEIDAEIARAREQLSR